jgi:hypothetical protein
LYHQYSLPIAIISCIINNPTIRQSGKKYILPFTIPSSMWLYFLI